MIQQMANNKQPSRTGFMNTLAETMYRELQPKKYDVKLPSAAIKPPKNFNEAQGRVKQWFEAFKKERDGMLRFNTWIRMPQRDVTPSMKKLALAHITSITLNEMERQKLE
jgi:hypothetical protein